MGTILEMSLFDCITKERFDKEYGIKNDEGVRRIENEERNDYSVGEDLERFIQRIKNGEIIEKDHKVSYLLRLLDKEERRKLDRNDAAFYDTFLCSHIVPLCKLSSGIQYRYTESTTFV